MPHHSEPRIERVVLAKASSSLADQLRDQILSGKVGNGDILPSERVLTEKSGLSRATVREALRILESEGFLSTRRGAHGGAVVRQPDSELLIRHVSFLVRSSEFKTRSLLEARAVIEPACARLAALHRTKAAIAQVQRASEQLESAGDDHIAFRAGNVAWHLAVARAGDNELLTACVVAMVSSLLELTAPPLSAARRESVMRAHDRVTSAIIEQNPDAAERHMRAHLDAFAYLRSKKMK